VGIEELAERYGKSVRTVFRWKRKGMPTREDGRFDLSAVEAWLERKAGVGEPDVGAAVEGGGADRAAGGQRGAVATRRDFDGKEFWDKEGKQWQAKLRELDFRKRVGELIEVRRVEDEFVARIQAAKLALLALERSLPPELIACRSEREMSSVIHRAVRDVLTGFSRPLPAEMHPNATEAADAGGADDSFGAVDA
jgi:hypothetical protein